MKQRIDIKDSQKQQHTDARSTKARKWARLMVFCLLCLCLTAIWQDKRLAPPVHLGMQKVAGMAIEYIENSEMLSEVLAAAQKNYADLASDG